MRSSEGCWTCRLRRKKCDETHPVCVNCAALQITCFYSDDKPEWMDGGVKQKEIAERLKREVKERFHVHGGEEALPTSSYRTPTGHITADETVVPAQRTPTNMGGKSCVLIATMSRECDMLRHAPDHLISAMQHDTNYQLTDGRPDRVPSYDRSDTTLGMFYLDHVLPFLFPFYCPSPNEGGRAWILELIWSSPVVRHTMLCQSSYFWSLGRRTAGADVNWERVLMHANDALLVLRRALQVIEGSNITEHLHGAVRILTSIIQVQRFEIAILSFGNCQTHLIAALALFKQILGSSNIEDPAESKISFEDVYSRLGPPSGILPSQNIHVSSAEQIAFSFSSALLVLVDVIASIIQRKEPSLYLLHGGLLKVNDSMGPCINLEEIVGCQNWVILQIGEISVLDTWKRACMRAGNLDVMDLVHRATAIKCTLQHHLARLDDGASVTAPHVTVLQQVLAADKNQQMGMPSSQIAVVTRVWAHAALIYLFTTVSGWQPAHKEVRDHVSRIIELTVSQSFPLSLLRTTVWPFCVAGCLAEPTQEAQFRGIVQALQPRSAFGTLYRALDIMEAVWRDRHNQDHRDRDLATCFRSQSDLVLLL